MKSPRVKPDVKQEMTEAKVKLEESGAGNKVSDDDLDEMKSPMKKKLHLDNITKIETNTVDDKQLAEDAEQSERSDMLQDDSEQTDGEQTPLDLDQPDHLEYSLVQPQHVPHLSIEDLKDPKHLHRLQNIALFIKNSDDVGILNTVCEIVIDSGNYGNTSDCFNFDLCNLDKQAIRKISISLKLEHPDEI